MLGMRQTLGGAVAVGGPHRLSGEVGWNLFPCRRALFPARWGGVTERVPTRRFNTPMKKTFLSSIFFLALLIANSMAWANTIAIEGGQTRYVHKQEIKVAFDVSSEKGDTRQWWVGLFKSSDSAQTQNYETYAYLGDAKRGVVTLNAPERSGKFHLKLVDGNYVEKGAKRIPFVVASIDPASVEMNASTRVVAPGGEIVLKVVSKETFGDSAWVGTFDAGAPAGADGYKSYQYLRSRADGVYTFKAPEQMGDYQFRLISSERGEEVKRLAFKVGYQQEVVTVLELEKATFEPNEPMAVRFKSHKEFPKDAWIGVFPKDGDQSAYLAYEYMRGEVNGEVGFVAPPKKGEYSLRMISSENGQEVQRVSFKVTNDLAAEPLRKKLMAEGSVSLYGIYFDVGESVIKPDSKPTLKLIADMLRASPDLKVQVQGHTDSQGNDADNMKLSTRRAAAVRDALISEHSVPEKQLDAKGFGESSPKSSNDTAKGRALNRRVELKRL